MAQRAGVLHIDAVIEREHDGIPPVIAREEQATPFSRLGEDTLTAGAQQLHHMVLNRLLERVPQETAEQLGAARKALRRAAGIGKGHVPALPVNGLNALGQRRLRHGLFYGHTHSPLTYALMLRDIDSMSSSLGRKNPEPRWISDSRPSIHAIQRCSAS